MVMVASGKLERSIEVVPAASIVNQLRFLGVSYFLIRDLLGVI